MKHTKNLILVLTTVLLFSFANKINAKTYCMENQTEKPVWILYTYQNNDNFGQLLDLGKTIRIKPINFTPIGEGYAAVDKSEIKAIYIFESINSVVEKEGKISNYIAMIENNPEFNNITTEIIALDTGNLIIITE
ncbi:MAG: hypothetical protein ABIF12_03560 [bacterium]